MPRLLSTRNPIYSMITKIPGVKHSLHTRMPTTSYPAPYTQPVTPQDVTLPTYCLQAGLKSNSGSYAGTEASETYGNPSTCRSNPFLFSICSNSSYSIFVYPRQVEQQQVLKMLVCSLQGKNVAFFFFFNLQTHTADIIREALPSPLRHKSTAQQPS